MHNNVQKKMTLALTGFVLILFIIPMISDSNNQTQLSKSEIKSAYTDHGPISITGDDGLAAFFLGNESTMDGESWGTAYRLENFTINMYDERVTCITIRDTTKFFNLSSLELSTYNTGILSCITLDNCSNIQVDNITAFRGGFNPHNTLYIFEIQQI